MSRVAGLRTGAAGRQRTEPHAAQRNGISRRTFIGWLIAAPTLIAAAEITTAPAQAAIPTVQPVDDYDLSDLLTDAALPTSNLITVEVNPDGTVSFALPRAEVGQGITTAVAMTIADEMGLALDKVTVTLADARPELLFNQLTGGSNTMHAIYTPVRVAAALARERMTDAAAQHLGGTASGLLRPQRDHHRARMATRSASASSPGAPRSSATRGCAWHSSRPRSRRSSARRSRGSTPTTSSPAPSSSPWTSTSPARCRRWCADRRPSTATRSACRTWPR